MLASEDVIITWHSNTPTTKNDDFHEERNAQLLSKGYEYICVVIKSRNWYTNEGPELVGKGAKQEQVLQGFQGALIAEHTVMRLKGHPFPLQQISSAESIFQE